MFKYKVGNILDTECKYILNPVNCVGTMGKGLALQIAKKYPESVDPYKKDCQYNYNCKLCLKTCVNRGGKTRSRCGFKKAK